MPSKNTKKKLKQNAKSVNKQVEEIAKETETDIAENQIVETETAPKIAEVQTIEIPAENVKDEKNKKQTKKEKKGSKAKKKIKEVASELKKVTWPTFPQIVKKTSTVIAVVLVFAVVLFGIDALLERVYNLFINGIN